MNESKLLLLVSRLHKLSNISKVPWEQTGIDGVYQAAYANYIIHISHNAHRDSYDFRLLDTAGTTLEAFDDEYLTNLARQFPTYSLPARTGHDSLEDIYRQARRHALGVASAVDDLLAALGDD